MDGDPVGVLEAAYALQLSDEQWLQGVTDAALPSLNQGRGLAGAIYDARQPAKLQLTKPVGAGMSGVSVQLVRLGAQSAAAGIIARVRWETCGMLSEVISKRELESIRLLKVARVTMGVKDIFGLNAGDPTLRGCVFCAPATEQKTLPARFKETWGRVAAHVAAGLRLRHQLEQAQALTDGAEAVLDPGGGVLHAEGPAKGKAERLALRGASLALDHARTKKVRRGDPDEAVRLWRALVQGRWSLVDHFERDGRRFLVARRNDPLVDGHKLTLRERQVVAFACLGHSNKLIAYELGISVPTAASALGSAMRKLGTTRRVELIRLVETGAL